ncbi:MAG: ABC transporter permease [Pseudomonadota bacterium]
MVRLALTRMLSAFLVVIAVFLVTFLLLRAAPGRPGDGLDQVGEEVRTNQARRLGTDQPIHRHLADVAGAWLQGDLGRSLVRGEPVGEAIGRTWPVSLELGGYALVIALFLGLGGGLLAGTRDPSGAARGLDLGALVVISLSALGLGTLVRVVLAGTGRFTLGGWDDPLDRLLPALVLGVVYGAYLLEMVRASTVEAVRSPWVRAARARGVSRRRVLLGHILPGALIPMVEALGPVIARLLTGSFVVEVLFEVPGISRIFMDAAAARDYPMILGVVMVYTVTITALNTSLEVAHAALDPRLRSGEVP